jgi:prepilin-type processing-associated H-X9-DG protein
MDENLVGYLLNTLDPETHREVEHHLETDPGARERLETLRRALEPLAADTDEVEPPPGLVVRTLGRVAEYICRDLPHAPPQRPRAAGVMTPLWRRADVLVAACLLITFLGFTIPWVVSVYHQANVTACQNNLRQFYAGLRAYSEQHRNQFPDVHRAADAPRNVAGLVVPILMDARALPREASIRCPANGGPQPCPWTLQELRDMDLQRFQRHVHELSSCYAYSLGHLSNREVVGPRFDADKPNHLLPIMADCPPPNPRHGNSLNHGSRGQNVLFADGSVKLCTLRTVGFGGDDIYLNKDHKVAAGLDWKDAALGGSSATPLP